MSDKIREAINHLTARNVCGNQDFFEKTNDAIGVIGQALDDKDKEIAELKEQMFTLAQGVEHGISENTKLEDVNEKLKSKITQVKAKTEIGQAMLKSKLADLEGKNAMTEKNFQGYVEMNQDDMLSRNAEIKTLRMLLWLRHGCGRISHLYGDDGEMQCSKCGIDFKRTKASEIEKTFFIAGLLKLKRDGKGKS